MLRWAFKFADDCTSPRNSKFLLGLATTFLSIRYLKKISHKLEGILYIDHQALVMGERIENMKSNENQVKYRTFDARFNSTIFSMIHGISAVLFKILKIWSRRS